MNGALFLLLLSCGFQAAPAADHCEWTRVRNALSLPENETAGDDVDFGFATDISADGKIMAVGGYQFNSMSGMMRIFRQDNATATGWELIGGATGNFSQQRFAWDLAVSGDGGTVAVGSDYRTGTGVEEVRVYKVWFGSSIVPLGQALLQDDTTEDELGSRRLGHTVSLSFDGLSLAVGSAQVVHLFRFDESEGQWIQAATFTDPPDRAYGTLAVSLSADGDTMALGQSRFEVSGTDTTGGRVRIVHGLSSDDSSSWTFSEPKDADNNGARILNFDLSANGKVLAVMTLSEQVRVYRFVEDLNSWIPQGQDLSGVFGGDHGDALSLSADGSVLAVGADDNDNGVGYARVYSFVEGTWYRVGCDLLGDGPGSEFGDSVALDDTGARLAVGSEGGGQSGTGYVRYFTIDTGCLVSADNDAPSCPEPVGTQEPTKSPVSGLVSEPTKSPASPASPSQPTAGEPTVQVETKERRFAGVRQEFVGARVLNSGEKAKFNRITEDWFNGFYADKESSEEAVGVYDMSTRVAVENQVMSEKTVAEDVVSVNTVFFNQTLIYRASELAYAPEDYVLMPYFTPSERAEYETLLKTNIAAFSELKVPLRPPFVALGASDADKCNDEEEEGISAGGIVAIVFAILFVFGAVGGFYYHYAFVRNEAKGEPMESASPRDPSACVPVDDTERASSGVENQDPAPQASLVSL